MCVCVCVYACVCIVILLQVLLLHAEDTYTKWFFAVRRPYSCSCIAVVHSSVAVSVLK